jgi:hypothetical protein
VITHWTRPRWSRTAHTLIEEHALLLGQDAARANDLLAVAAEDRWPRTELQALLDYVRAELIRQIADEEWMLFPPHPTPSGFDRLRRDHLRLRHNTQALEDATSGHSESTAAQIAATTWRLLTLLERHFSAEEDLLAAASAPCPVHATADLTGRSHEWYPLTEGTMIDLDALPADQVIDATVERLLRLRADEHVELRSSNDLCRLWRQMDRIDPYGYGFVYLQEGPQRWAMQVTRRQPR